MSTAPVKPKPGLLRSSSKVGVMTMASRVLGLLRDVVFAHTIGAGGGADVFIVAFKIPNFMRRLFAEGAFAQAFVPVLSEYRQKGPHAAVQALVDRVAGALGLVLLVVTALAVAGAPLVATVFAPGFRVDSPEKFALATDMIRITFPYLMLISLSGFVGAILNSYDRFAIPAFTPVLLNITLIAAALIISPMFEAPAMGLAWGVLAAGVLQFLFQLPFLKPLNITPVPKLDWQDPGVKRILALMVPALFGVSVSQINLMLDTIIASLLPDGSPSWLYYSERLADLPLGVFAVAIATVILPNLSRQYSASNPEAFSRTLDWAIRIVVLIAAPAVVALVIMAEPILTTLFQYGEMTPRDTLMASMSLRAYALGLMAFMLIKVLAPGFYARQDMKTPVRIGVVAMAANMLLNLVFVLPLHSYYQLGFVGLALATSLAAYINVALLYHGLQKRGVYIRAPGWSPFLVRVLTANIAMAALLLWGLSVWPQWGDWSALARVWRLAALCLAGAAVYGFTLLATGLRPRDFRQASF
ncbi:murein biosynthesis integral membrane protein MurJ [Gilvimarinus sp. SDUM040013]|uniref:Probable lipid II flippase MurJ n=1 Tax=Gilvimarinus gilvus TaxID=3058038 RepID=A0ABU4S180_9GAMM|nr:murein biosynthesis integral membrane protein MurJ [Gilvimarinus sp. SDUM040013]MDO3384891.1 murein biosynthesis integral membrane protein MurJ [Gilvimarinus sp. SDUM040013]MDX6850684.1 murein biosynthesis integral membrane protein MurJ [Gilvimarinus sp. SDUM040013]